MDTIFVILAWLFLSTMLHIGPIRAWLDRDTGNEKTLQNLAKTVVWGLGATFSNRFFRGLLLIASLMWGSDRLEDLEFLNRYGKPLVLSAVEIASPSPAILPRYVRIPDLVPTETGVEETRSRYFIPMSKTYLYGADSTGSALVPAEDTVGHQPPVNQVTVFVSQPYEADSLPVAGVAREVVGQLDTDYSPDNEVTNIFREDGYAIGSPLRLIKAGTLPGTKEQLYVELVLLVLLGLAQILAFFHEYADGRANK